MLGKRRSRSPGPASAAVRTSAVAARRLGTVPRQQRLSAPRDDERAEESESESGSGSEAAEAAVEDGETADEKRVRLTRLYLQSIQPNGGRAQTRGREGRDEKEAAEDQEGADSSESEEGDGSTMEDVISHRLHDDVASQHGRRHTSSLASLLPSSLPSARSLRGHRLSVTCTALSSDERLAYSGSKDGSIIEWDVDSGQRRVQWRGGSGQSAAADSSGPSSHTTRRYGLLALTASSDGRLLASAGQDGSIRVWDVRSRQTAAQSSKEATIAAKAKRDSNGSPAPLGASHSSVPARSSRSVAAVAPPALWCEWGSAHRSFVSSLSFRLGSSELFSASFDRTVKLFDASSKAYIETLFGHTAEVQDVHCLYRNRAVSVASDKTARLWKVVEESQLLFRIDTAAVLEQPTDSRSTSNPTTGSSNSYLSLDCCRLLDDDHFLTGGDDGSVALWNINKKRPMHVYTHAHGADAWSAHSHSYARYIDERFHRQLTVSYVIASCFNGWLVDRIVSVAACPFSDVAFSGSSDGHINVYQCNTANTAHYHTLREPQKGGRRAALQLVNRIPCVGYVNSISCATSGRFLVAGVGQEHRTGRWTDNVKSARNGIAIVDLSSHVTQ